MKWGTYVEEVGGSFSSQINMSFSAQHMKNIGLMYSRLSEELM
jgi:hypothetical protein